MYTQSFLKIKIIMLPFHLLSDDVSYIWVNMVWILFSKTKMIKEKRIKKINHNQTINEINEMVSIFQGKNKCVKINFWNWKFGKIKINRYMKDIFTLQLLSFPVHVRVVLCCLFCLVLYFPKNILTLMIWWISQRLYCSPVSKSIIFKKVTNFSLSIYWY